MSKNSKNSIVAANKRGNFQRLAALKWVRKNRPDVMEMIRAEAFRLWPISRKREENDYTFLNKKVKRRHRGKGNVQS